jgi:N-acyl-D-amino-acid deacylase
MRIRETHGDLAMTSLASLLLMSFACSAEPAPSVIVIQNATVHDGSGKPGVKADVVIEGEKIVAVGAVKADAKAHTIDGSGLILAPGFIDLHTHCDAGDPTIAQAKGRANRCYVTQGVTTVVTGNCGTGPTDMKAFFGTLDKNGVGTNVIHQVPHNSLRAKVMGNANRGPTTEELEKMEGLVEQMMKEGAWGLSTGLIYTPGTYAKTDEIIALAKVAAKYQGFYASHIRDESTGLLTAIEEAIRIGKEGGLPVHISHIKCSGKGAWHKVGEAVATIEKARKDGQIVTADQYPYIASSTSLSATVIPSRFRDGTAKEYLARLDDEEKGAQIRKAVESAMKGKEAGKNIIIARYRPNTKWQGRSIAAIALDEKKSPTEIVIEIEKHGGAAVVNFNMSEEDVRLYMKQPFVATASDGSSQVPGDSVPHPRSYGTFPRKIGRFAIADGTITLEHAIRSASGLPADILRLKDRGYVKPGYYADLVLFDPKTFRDTATFEKPHQYTTGIKYVFVNGKAVIENGEYKDILAGKALRHGPGK